MDKSKDKENIFILLMDHLHYKESNVNSQDLNMFSREISCDN